LSGLQPGAWTVAKPLTDLYLFMWNPLVLLHHVGNGHNDILTGFFLALAFYLAIVGAGFWIIPLLVLATLLKYGPAILIPLALVFVIKNYGWKKAILSCLLAGRYLCGCCRAICARLAAVSLRRNEAERNICS